jgi:glucan-binding YG repeat protein
VWIENVGFTEEQQIANGASYIYTNVSATSAELWIDMGTHWYWSENHTLTACEIFTFTWG